MKRLFRFLKWTLGILGIIVIGIFVAGYFLYNKAYNAPYPDIHASTDSLVISHGKHLVFGTAHCSECHFNPKDSSASLNGEDFILSGGGFPFEFPGGNFYSPNISSDKETGIGQYSDGEIARALRYGVKRNGKALIPAMEFQNLSDEDLTSIISYLRTVQADHHKVPENNFNLLGKAIFAFFIRPENPKVTPPIKMQKDSTLEYGRYLAESISNCKGCHTERSQNTGAYIGMDLAGGSLGPVHGEPTKELFAPNLTPDEETGHIYNWTFEQFENRFHQGRLIPQTIMPWGQFKHLDRTELVAIWKYLHSVKPIHKDNGSFVHEIK